MSSMDIHSATIASTRAAPSVSGNSQISPALQRLMKQKFNIESELDELVSVLETVSRFTLSIPPR